MKKSVKNTNRNYLPKHITTMPGDVSAARHSDWLQNYGSSTRNSPNIGSCKQASWGVEFKCIHLLWWSENSHSDRTIIKQLPPGDSQSGCKKNLKCHAAQPITNVAQQSKWPLGTAGREVGVREQAQAGIKSAFQQCEMLNYIKHVTYILTWTHQVQNKISAWKKTLVKLSKMRQI